MILKILAVLCVVVFIFTLTAYGELRYRYDKLKVAHDEKWEFLNKLGINASGEFHRMSYYVHKMQEQLNLYKYRNVQYKRLVKFNTQQHDKLCNELKEYEEKCLRICSLCDQAIREETPTEQLAQDIIVTIGTGNEQS